MSTVGPVYLAQFVTKPPFWRLFSFVQTAMCAAPPLNLPLGQIACAPPLNLSLQPHRSEKLLIPEYVSRTIRILPSAPLRYGPFRRSIPDTWVTFHSEDIGNTFGPTGFARGASLQVSSSK
jgi:hypothetical protein